MANIFLTAGGVSAPGPVEEKSMSDEVKDRRTFMYKLNADGVAVDAYCFESPDEVPKGQGWVDSPAKVKKTGKPLIDRKKAATVEENEDE